MNLTYFIQLQEKKPRTIKRGEQQETTKKTHLSIALNMYEVHGLEIQASLPLPCSHGPTCLLHPVYQILDFICCISFCCKSAAEQITQISIFFRKKKINHLFSQQSFILKSIQGSWGLAGQSCCPWLGWAGLGWADLAGLGWKQLQTTCLLFSTQDWWANLGMFFSWLLQRCKTAGRQIYNAF